MINNTCSGVSIKKNQNPPRWQVHPGHTDAAMVPRASCLGYRRYTLASPFPTAAFRNLCATHQGSLQCLLPIHIIRIKWIKKINENESLHVWHHLFQFSTWANSVVNFNLSFTRKVHAFVHLNYLFGLFSESWDKVKSPLQAAVDVRPL